MPRDQRLYMTFPNDFHRHPKVSRLTADQFRAFVEMNGEARIADNDGVFTIEEAEFMWGRDVMDALVGSHPTRPLVTRGVSYVIRDYAEHQETREAREKRRETNAANGAKGGRPRKNPGVTQQKPTGLPMGTESQANETQTKAESESESEDFYSPSKSQSSSNRARVSTDAIPISETTRRGAANQGVKNLRTIVDAVSRIGITVTADQSYQLCLHLLGKAKTHPDDATAYVLTCIRDSTAEVQKHLFEHIGAEAA